ncbi:carbon-nitrogen hydrolase family protein [[Mycobacterium] holstebronense]|uniref:Carbon-nitrogen hydrolase family protein n=1 Tax=[Mycobacterium] holstebronense TaxID=3064288 RepID=A0ABM9LM12_9MYCO|nr:carbon-nitrogen hydrolase family protein [Mycolicibacter sp. MU0102]CAJ1501221.1 carbon-nitrogen hydrolase family protein [Mycolicibacter sp. MU0102]
MVLAAAVQLEAVLGDVPANLAACERLADEAGRAGAKIIALPEFFSTGIGFEPTLATAALPPDGAATELLTRLARRHDALVGGSFLCRDPDGHVRNAYLLAGPDGVVGRHDKDLPTMWENAFYTGGDDDGVLAAGDHTVGAAVCWELMRTQTVRRLRGRVDLVMTGSGWWSIPRWSPHVLFDRLERNNAGTARRAAASFAQYVGAPVVHAAHAGALTCAMPWLPLRYRGHFEGATLIANADGTVIAERRADQGEGIVLAEITPGRQPARLAPPAGFWLHRRGTLPTAVWHYQRWHGRRWYRHNVAQNV